MQNSSEKLFVFLILFFGLAVAYLLSSNEGTPAVEETAVAARGEIPPELKTISLNFSIFDSILFKKLKVFGVIPVTPGQTGRTDPFIPY